MLQMMKQKQVGKYQLLLHVHKMDAKKGAVTIKESGRQVFNTGEVPKPHADNFFRSMNTEPHIRNFLSKVMNAGTKATTPFGGIRY